MSVDLSIVPMKGDIYNIAYSLAFDRRDYGNYEKLNLLSEPVTVKVVDYECDDPYITHDPYGDKLTTVTIEQFLKIYKAPDLTVWDKGIIALLEAHNPSNRILLYYH